MTVCLYISPKLDEKPPFWMVMADTIGTLKGMEGGYSIIPTTVTASNLNHTSSVVMVRKSYIVSGRAAVAFAGNGDVIRDCLEEIKYQMPIWLNTDRPMQRLQDIVNEMKNIEIVGATIDPDAGVLNYISPINRRENIESLGDCAIIGSGRDSVIKSLVGFDRDTKTMNKVPSEQHALECWSMINSSNLASEINGHTKDWGGYIEHLVPAGPSWIRGPKTVNFFMFAEMLPDDKATVHLISRVIAYDPGGLDGRILSVSQGRDGDLIKEFILEDVLTAEKEPDQRSAKDFWSEWSPEMASVTVILNDRLNNSKYSTRMFGPKYITFEMIDGKFSYGLSVEAADIIGEYAVGNWNRKYVSSWLAR